LGEVQDKILLFWIHIIFLFGIEKAVIATAMAIFLQFKDQNIQILSGNYWTFLSSRLRTSVHDCTGEY